GRISADQFLGGEMRIDAARSELAVDRIGRDLKINRIAAAESIVRVANANMERAIRVVSVERGYDPRDFALVGFGGCGGLHACEIAAELGIRTVIVPSLAGALSALGMLLADHTRDYSASALQSRKIERIFRDLERKARRDMPRCRVARSADLRYAGQSYELNVPWNAADVAAPFHRLHHSIYGYSNPERAVEIVTVRVKATIVVSKPKLRAERGTRAKGLEKRRIRTGGSWRLVPVYQRSGVPSRAVGGPALVTDYGATTLIPDGWRFAVDRAGNLIITQ